MLSMPKNNLLLIIALSLALVTSAIALADVIIVYYANANSIAKSVVSVMTGSYSCPCCGVLSSWQYTNTGFSATVTAITLSTSSGYVIHVPTPLVGLRAYAAGVLTVAIRHNNYVSSVSINGTPIYPSPGSISLSTGTYTLYENLTISTPLTSPITLSGIYNYTPTQGVVYIYTHLLRRYKHLALT